MRLKYKVDKVEFKILSFPFYWILLSDTTFPSPPSGSPMTLSPRPHPSWQTILFLASSKYVPFVVHTLRFLLGLFHLIWSIKSGKMNWTDASLWINLPLYRTFHFPRVQRPRGSFLSPSSGELWGALAFYIKPMILCKAPNQCLLFF